MTIRTQVFAWLLMGLLPSASVAQDVDRGRARAVLSPPVWSAVETLALDAEADGVPSGPLFAKALEGAAKGIPEDRLLPALNGFAARLRDAHSLLGPGTEAPLLVAGVDALTRGVPGSTLRGLAVGERRAINLVVLGDLVQSGIPATEAVSVLREALSRRTADDALLEIPALARRLLRERGSTDAALEALRRRIRDSGGRVGPPAPPGPEPDTRDRRGGGG